MLEDHIANRLTELDRPACLERLADGSFGRVVAALPNGTPVIRPVNYVFDPGSQSVLIRTHPGSKLYALLHCERATFEIDAAGADTRTGWSVIVNGVVEEITEPGELRRIETLGAETWAPGSAMRWIRIRAFSVTGRQLEA
jgi:nitroimidazol reductase NimA-like FMN-containing flavoprotein (pyridoxamine 5'-phosphate oxidase superfamily)